MVISKKTMKVLSAIVIILTVIASLCNICCAIDINEINTSKALANGGDDALKNVGSSIASIIRNVGIILALIILMILGIKYMLGSAEDKADYKKSMIPYIVGAVLLFGASGIAQVVVSLSNTVTNTK